MSMSFSSRICSILGAALFALPVGALAGTSSVQPCPGEVVASQAGGISAVLAWSQRQRIAARVGADPDSERAGRIRANFDRLVTAARPPMAVRLAVLDGGVQAEAMLGCLLVVGDAVGDLPEHEQLMLLAHELGHLMLDHWKALTEMYRRHIPGEVRPETTEPVAAALGREAHDQSYRHEFEADAFGYTLARRLGVQLEEAQSLLMRSVLPHDTATHPATRRRLMQLRVLHTRLAEGEAPGAQPRATLAGDPIGLTR